MIDEENKMNKKAQFGLIGLYDASSLPKWVLYPLMLLIMFILLVIGIFMIILIIAFIKGDVSMIPFGYGYGWHMPIGFWSTGYSECFQNGIKIACENLTK